MIKNSIKLDKSSKITWQLSFVSIMGRKHVWPIWNNNVSTHRQPSMYQTLLNNFINYISDESFIAHEHKSVVWEISGGGIGWTKLAISRGGLSSTRGLGPTMTARGLGPTMTARGLGSNMTAQCQSIGISIGMLPQTLIMSRLDQLSRLGVQI
jgi:hypothetical protein